MEKTSSQHLLEVAASLARENQAAMFLLLTELLGKLSGSKTGLPSFVLTYSRPSGKATLEWQSEPIGESGTLSSLLPTTIFRRETNETDVQA